MLNTTAPNFLGGNMEQASSLRHIFTAPESLTIFLLSRVIEAKRENEIATNLRK